MIELPIRDRINFGTFHDTSFRRVVEWVWELPEHLNLHLPPARAVDWQRMGYQRSLPWPIRKTIEFYVNLKNADPRATC